MKVTWDWVVKLSFKFWKPFQKIFSDLVKFFKFKNRFQIHNCFNWIFRKSKGQSKSKGIKFWISIKCLETQLDNISQKEFFVLYSFEISKCFSNLDDLFRKSFWTLKSYSNLKICMFLNAKTFFNSLARSSSNLKKRFRPQKCFYTSQFFFSENMFSTEVPKSS